MGKCFEKAKKQYNGDNVPRQRYYKSLKLYAKCTAKNQDYSYISSREHFRAYVASQIIYECDHCKHFEFNRSLYDLPKPRYEKENLYKALKKGVVQNPLMALSIKITT